jgi:hypothetical protein
MIHNASKTLVALLMSATLLTSCAKKGVFVSQNYTQNPAFVIYKTKVNRDNNVPIRVMEDRKTIITYPAPTDVFTNGKLAYPTKLADGYLLDNRGIAVSSVFLSFDYETYSKLREIPKESVLLNAVLDFEPFLEMYNCGYRYDYKNEVQAANDIIQNGGLKNCKCLIKGKQ